MAQVFIVTLVVESVTSVAWDTVTIFRDIDTAKKEIIGHALQFLQSCVRHGIAPQQLKETDVVKYKIKEYTFHQTMNRYMHVCDYHISGLLPALQQWHMAHAPALTFAQFMAQMVQQPQLALSCIKPC